ncbi:hypothetical protein [Azospirillum sp. B506]|uniref:hypothetical protein n=1 Tax=Azospirillum sp. B506 TaxID=137721 RepID=UPI00034A610E|nr:hypothetical protein [Azospirillum sp. B506]
MRDLAQALVLTHALLLLAMASVAVGAWAALFLAVPSIGCAAFLTYVAALDATAEP